VLRGNPKGEVPPLSIAALPQFATTASEARPIAGLK
jgi:hypothetical protein